MGNALHSPGHLILLLSILVAAAMLAVGCAQLGVVGQGKKELTFSPDTVLPAGKVGDSYEYFFCKPPSAAKGATCGGLQGATTDPSGGNPPYSFYYGTGAGLKPPGLVLELNGRFSGTPTTAGSYEFEVCFKDVEVTEKCKTVSMKVNPAGAGINETKTATTTPTYSGTLTFAGERKSTCQRGCGSATNIEAHFSTTITFSDLTFKKGETGKIVPAEGSYSYSCSGGNTRSYGGVFHWNVYGHLFNDGMAIEISSGPEDEYSTYSTEDKTCTYAPSSGNLAAVFIHDIFSASYGNTQSKLAKAYLANYQTMQSADLLSLNGETVPFSRHFVDEDGAVYDYNGTLTLTKQ